MSKDNPNADWRAYVEISPDFTPDQRAQIEQSMEFIWQAQNDEGKKLLQTATNNAGRRLLMAPASDENFQLASIVGVNFDQATSLVFNDEEGEEHHVSLNGTLVHEIFHAAQAANSFSNIRAIVARELEKTDIPPAERPAVLKELDTYLNYALNEITADKLDTGFTARAMYTQEPETPMLDKHLDKVFPVFQPLLEQLSDPTRSIEQQATRYVDAFMRKNARQEPMRYDYENGDLGVALDTPIAYGPMNQLNATMGFNEVAPQTFAGARPLPTVAPVGFEGIIRDGIRDMNTKPAGILPIDFDLERLEGCAHDAAAPCYESGQLPSPPKVESAASSVTSPQR